jgi:hypothetical protein
MESILVSVTLRFPVTVNPGSQLVIEIQDTTMQDVSSTTVAKRVLGLNFEEHFSGISGVAIEYDAPAAGRVLTIHATLDLDGDSRAGTGDFKSTQAYPIQKGSTEITLELRKI